MTNSIPPLLSYEFFSTVDCPIETFMVFQTYSYPNFSLKTEPLFWCLGAVAEEAR